MQFATIDRMQVGTFSELGSLFLRFNRKIISSVEEVRPALSVKESPVLLEIEVHPGITAKELTKILMIEKSVVSRILSDFEKRGFIASSVSDQDRRGKLLSITALGKKVLLNDTTERNEIAKLSLKPLGESETEEFVLLLHRMADSLAAENIQIRSGDHPAKIAVRRLTRAMGVLSGDAFLTGIPIEDLQIIHLLGTNGNVMKLSEIRSILPYEATALSRIISRLESERILQKLTMVEDNRYVMLSLTKMGQGLFRHAEAAISDLMSKAVKILSIDEKVRLFELMRSFLIESGAATGDSSKRSGIFSVRSEAERKAARAFLVRELVRQGLEDRTPERILDRSSIAYAGYSDGAIVSLAEVQKRGGVLELVYVISPGDSESAELIAVLFEQVFKRKAVDSIVFDKDAPGVLPLIRKGDLKDGMVKLKRSSFNRLTINS